MMFGPLGELDHCKLRVLLLEGVASRPFLLLGPNDQQLCCSF